MRDAFLRAAELIDQALVAFGFLDRVEILALQIFHQGGGGCFVVGQRTQQHRDNVQPSLLRGAPHRELAVRFLRFALSPEGQKLWNYRPGTPGGPKRFALRRLPIRRDFYPSDDPIQQTVCASNQPYLADNLADPKINPYALGAQFIYQPRWTGAHFALQRDLIRAMCMDSGDELRAAWQAILAHGGPDKNPRAMALLLQMPDRPVPLDWRSAIGAYKQIDRLECLREWTAFFRKRYDEAREAAGE